MKRFHCTICKKMKRVRKYPLDIQNEFATVPEERTGTCARHSSIGTRIQSYVVRSNDRKRA